MSPLSNAERQKRFRQLTMMERQLKVDVFDLLLAAIESQQSIPIDLPDGRILKVIASNGESRIQIVADAKRQAAIARARFRLRYGD
jgi:hypothetical protein